MPRYARQAAPHSVQHLIARFVNREFLFDAAGARDEYLRRAALALARTDWRPIAFALMSSHAHWVMVAGEQPSSSFVLPLHCGFAGWLNRTHGRLGPVFAERHRTVAVVGETAATLLAYVHNNPVRAGVVEDPSDSTWTSHLAYADATCMPPWLDVERGLALAGFSATRRGRLAFHEFVVTRCGEGRCAMMSGGGLRQHRARVRADLQAPVEVGTPTVTTRSGRRSMNVPTVVPLGCRIRYGAGNVPARVVSAVARTVDLPVEVIRSRSRVRTVVTGRRLALLIWCRHLGHPAAPMARVLGVASSTASELLAGASSETQQLALRIARDAFVTRRS